MLLQTRPILNTLRLILLKYFGTNHNLYTFFIYFMIMVCGIFCGATVLNPGNQQKINVPFVQEEFIEMIKETREEEQKDIFIENCKNLIFNILALHNVEIIRQKDRGNFYENFITKSKPVIITNIASSWPAYHLWKDEYLSKMTSKKMNVQSSRINRFSRHFTEQYTNIEQMKLLDFINIYRSPERNSNYFLKGSLEKSEHLSDIPPELSFAKELFKQDTSILLGAGGQVTYLGTSNDETFICQLVGLRKFMLFDPLQSRFLNPVDGLPLESRLDPSSPNDNLLHAKAVIGKLNPGDILYIPSNWWYFEIAQQGRNLAVEYEYSTHNFAFSRIMDAMRSSKKDNLEDIQSE